MELSHKIKNKWEVLRAVAFVTYKEWSAYRTHSLVSVFVGPVYFLVQYFIWTALYGTNGSLAGIGLEQMIRYFGASALIGYLTMDFADWNLQMLVRTGKYLTFTLRPVHHRFFALSQKVGHRILGFFFEFLPCLIIFVILFRIPMIPEHLMWTILSVALAFLMNFYVNYCLGLTAFWLTKADGLRHVYGLIAQIFSGSLIPLVFFSEFLQKLLFFLPFQYTLYVPAMVWTGNYYVGNVELEIPQIVGIQAVATFVMLAVSEVLYRLSLKRFTGVGA